MKPIQTLIYIYISSYAHIPNLKLSSYGSGTTEGIRVGYSSAKQNFPRKTGTAATRDHEITTRRADAAELSRCRRTREVVGSAVAHVHLVLHVRFVLVLQT
jgi:hypothetical protein